MVGVGLEDVSRGIPIEDSREVREITSEDLVSWAEEQGKEFIVHSRRCVHVRPWQRAHQRNQRFMRMRMNECGVGDASVDLIQSKLALLHVHLPRVNLTSARLFNREKPRKFVLVVL